jgi:hypothetical protein
MQENVQFAYRVMVQYLPEAGKPPLTFDTDNGAFAWQQFEAVVAQSQDLDTAGFVVTRKKTPPPPPAIRPAFRDAFIPPAPVRTVQTPAPPPPVVAKDYSLNGGPARTVQSPAPPVAKDYSLNGGGGGDVQQQQPQIGIEQLQRVETLRNEIAAIDASLDNDPSGFERESTVNLLVTTLEDYLREYDFAKHPELHARWSEARDQLETQRSNKRPRT